MKELTVDAIRENLPRVTAFLEEALEACDCPMKAQMQIDVAADELFSNVAGYAYAGGPGKLTVRFAFEETNRMAVIRFIDSGVPFDPLQNDDPDVTAKAEDRKIGGLGIFLVKKLMDEVEYRRENDCNIVTVRKKT